MEAIDEEIHTVPQNTELKATYLLEVGKLRLLCSYEDQAVTRSHMLAILLNICYCLEKVHT